MKRYRMPACGLIMCAISSWTPMNGFAQSLFEVPDNIQSRWISFENPTGGHGAGGEANEGRKGAPSRTIKAGETVTLAEINGTGIIRRIWCTVAGKPEIVRGVVLRIYWEDEAIPAVEAPLQDFFGIPFGRQVAFESALFSNPEGRSFNCYVPMPFKKRARIVVENQSPFETSLFFDVDYTLGDHLPHELCYFHAHYRRENPTQPKKDFQVLPQVSGKGRFLGFNLGVRMLGAYQDIEWFGEGEMKVYLDGDQTHPTLVGTGTEDLVGSAWGLGRFDHQFQGCLLTAKDDGVWGFYRYFVPDPVYFHTGLRVELQQISGARAQDILGRMAPSDYPELVETHQRFDPEIQGKGNEWMNFEGPQDVCATAYWYQTLPSPSFGPLDAYSQRMKDLPAKTEQK
jgi:hypothetical protein